MRNSRIMSILAVVVGTAGCSGETPAPSLADDSRPPGYTCPVDARLTPSDREAMQQALADVVSRALQGDWPGFSLGFAENVTMMPPGAPAYAGRDTLVAGFEGVSITEFVSEIDYLDGCGDVAYGRGHHSWAMSIGEEGNILHEEGKWVSVWRRQEDGRWLVETDIWNGNGTAAGP